MTQETPFEAEDGGNWSWANVTLSVASTTAMPNETYLPYHLRPETYLVPIIFSLIFVAGVLGNGTLVLIFARHRNMRSAPNTYILSLALGDLLVIITCVPFTGTVYTFESWPYGPVVCKVQEFTKDVSVGVSVFTLTALSADRFFAIVDPLHRLGGAPGRPQHPHRPPGGEPEGEHRDLLPVPEHGVRAGGGGGEDGGVLRAAAGGDRRVLRADGAPPAALDARHAAALQPGAPGARAPQGRQGRARLRRRLRRLLLPHARLHDVVLPVGGRGQEVQRLVAHAAHPGLLPVVRQLLREPGGAVLRVGRVPQALPALPHVPVAARAGQRGQRQQERRPLRLLPPQGHDHDDERVGAQPAAARRHHHDLARVVPQGALLLQVHVGHDHVAGQLRQPATAQRARRRRAAAPP